MKPKKKTIRYTENDIEKLISRILNEDGDNFSKDFSNNLMGMEKPYLNDNEKIGEIIRTYENHIQQLRYILNRNRK